MNRLPVMGMNPGLMVLLVMGYLCMMLFGFVARTIFGLTMLMLAFVLVTIDIVCRIISGTPLDLSDLKQIATGN